MKPETTRHRLTDKDRDSVLKLIVCGLPTDEIADIMSISKSTVSYIRQAHTACLNKDWSVLQKLSTACKPTVVWAMKVTGTDAVFEETFTEPTVQNEPTPEVVEPIISRDDFMSISNTLQDICCLLTEIRDIIK